MSRTAIILGFADRSTISPSFAMAASNRLVHNVRSIETIRERGVFAVNGFLRSLNNDAGQVPSNRWGRRGSTRRLG